MKDLEKILGYNPHSIGIIMKEIVRRAGNLAREKRINFESKIKTGYNGKDDDLATDADTEAQKLCVKLLQENFPDYGIIAEEEDEKGKKKFLVIPHKTKYKIYFTIDPVDGTKAFGRRQSNGISTMLSLVVENEVVAVFIADINTYEIFGFRPMSENVWRIYQISDQAIKLEIKKKDPLKERHVLLRTNPKNYSKQSQKIIDVFRDIDVESGSIGINFSKIWKDEIAAFILEESYETPWDSNPVIGISKKMGFKFFRIDKNGITEINPRPFEKIMKRDYEVLIIHKSRVEELKRMLK